MSRVASTQTLHADDAAYPSGARDLVARSFAGQPLFVDPPPTLYVRGEIPSRPVFALVGTREPTRQSIAWTQKLVRALGERGFAIGSGGAEGIDEAAHRAALESGIPTLVVTVGGLDRPTIARRGTALDRDVLASGGALVSLDADGQRATRRSFFARNRLLAALSLATVAIEVRPKPGQGGSGHALRSARGLGRATGVVPHAPWEPGCLGALALHREGFVLIASEADALALASDALAPEATVPLERGESSERTVLSRPSLRPRLPAATTMGPGATVRAFEADLPRCSQELASLSEDARAALTLVNQSTRGLDGVCGPLGWPAARALRALLECVLAGVIDEAPPGRYTRRHGPRA